MKKITEKIVWFPAGLRRADLGFDGSPQVLWSVAQLTDDNGEWEAPVLTGGLAGNDLETAEKEYALLGRAIQIAHSWARDVGTKPNPEDLNA